MNDEQTARVLAMVAEGTISPSEGQELLDALKMPTTDYRGEPKRPASARKLVIGVTENGQMVAETAVALSLFHADRQFLPRQVRHYLNKLEVDLDQLIERAVALELTGTLTDVRQDQVNLWIALK